VSKSAVNDTAELVRILSLAEGFILVPVEVPGPDVARAQVAPLADAGWPTAAIEPVDDESWARLVASIIDAAAADARAVMVIGGATASAGLYAALRLVNQRRDSIVQSLARPLLWCGPAEFLKLTWERAPDFWSIRAMTLRLAGWHHPVREAPLWPGAWVADPPERLREMLAMARRQGDDRNAARAAATLAEALVARGELDEAAEVAESARSESSDSSTRAEAGGPPSFRMIEAVVSAMRGERDRAAAILGDASLAAGDPGIEGRRLVALGNLALDEDRAAAVRRFEQARDVLHGVGDLANEAVAVANLGVAAMAEGQLESAASTLEQALALARSAGDSRTEGRILSKIGRVQLLRRDSRRACATLEEALERVSDAADPRVEGEVLRRLARAYLELGDPEKAEGDARRGAAIARATGDDEGAREADEIAREAREALDDGS
jgi:tetratricopeptide (TPR) repeat protein